MTDRSYLDDFSASQQQRLSQELVAEFIECSRDPATNTADLVTRLKDVLEQALQEPGDAPESFNCP